MDHLGYYKTLGVSEGSSYHEIRKAYRRLVKKHHPDRNSSSHAEDTIKEINIAYEILSDKDKRKQYDALSPIRNIDTYAETRVSGQSQRPRDSFRNPSAEPRNSHRSTVNPNQQTNQNTTEGYNEWRYERFGDRLSARIRKDPTVITDESIVEDDGRSPRSDARFNILVEPSLCMAFGSCEVLAPKVFVLEKNKIVNPKVRIESEDGAPFEDILSAAETCPTKAIRIIDRHSGEQVFP
ncbi:MAG TPA: DnaJ domain-containing protein [Nitrososphaeraceae archaeon]|nr:DnaJ domain-containing protein [Nitrososphaeraceae archaeon]